MLSNNPTRFYDQKEILNLPIPPLSISIYTYQIFSHSIQETPQI